METQKEKGREERSKITTGGNDGRYVVSYLSAGIYGLVSTVLLFPFIIFSDYWGWIGSLAATAVLAGVITEIYKRRNTVIVDGRGMRRGFFWYERPSVRWEKIEKAEYNIAFTFRVKGIGGTIDIPLEALSDNYFIMMAQEKTEASSPLRNLIEKNKNK